MDYNRLMEEVESINGMCNSENMYCIEITVDNVRLIFINTRYERCLVTEETYNTPDNFKLKDALQKILIKYYTEMMKEKL